MASDGSVTIEITGDASDLLKELSGLKTKLSETKQQEENLGNRANGFGTVAKAACKVAATAFAAVGTAVAGAAAYAVNAGMNFEASMSNVAALSGATGEELQLLSDTAKQMGATTQFSATEAADALSYMALAGWDAQQSVDALPGVLDLAASSGMELASASDMVTDYLSAFGMEAKDSSYFADMLAYAQGNANTTAAGLGDAYKNCAANMHAAGQDVETTTSLLSMLANQGLKGSEAGTTLAATMRDITAKMKDGAIEIGDTSVAVTDANGNFRDMTDILTDVESATNGMGDAERATALSSTFTSDSIKGLNMILNAGVDEAAAFENELRNSTGTASAMADTMNDNLKGKITEFGSAIEGVAIQCYDAMQGPLKDGVQSAIDSVGKLSDQMANGKLKDSAEKLAEGFGSIIKEGGKLASDVLPKVIDGFAWFVDNGKTVATGVAAVAAGYKAYKTASAAVTTLSAAMQVLTAHETAHRLALVAANGGLSASSMAVGVLTGKITLATAAQAAWNAITALNPYAVLATGVAALTAGLVLYLATHDKEVAAHEEVCKAVDEERDSVDKLKQARDESMGTNMAEIDNAEALIYQFKQLTDETGRVKAGTDNYARAKSLANQINAVAPGAIEDLEDEEGAYLAVADSVELVIAKKRLEAEANANQDFYDEAVANAETAVERLNELDSQREQALANLDTAKQNFAECDSQYNAWQIEDAQKAVDEIDAAYSTQEQTVSDYYSAMSRQQEIWTALESDNIDVVKAAISDYENKIVEFTGTNAAECQQRAADSQAYYDKLVELKDKGFEIDDATLESARTTAEQQKQIAQEAADAQAQAIEDKRTRVTEAFGTTNAAILTKMQELYPELKSSGELVGFNYAQGIEGNIKAPTEAGKAMVLASKMAALIEANGADEIGQQFANGMLQGLIDNSGLPPEKAGEIMQQCIDASKDTAGIHSPSTVMAEQGLNLVQGLGNGITDNSSLATSPASTLMQNVLTAAQNGITGITSIGNMFSSLFGSGITSGTGAANSAASGVSSGAATSAKAQSGLFSTAGSVVATAFSTAIKNTQGLVNSSATAVSQSSAAAMNAQQGQYKSAGTTVATQFKTGISEQSSAVSSAAKEIANAGRAAAKDTHSEWKGAGEYLASGLARGISNGESSVIQSAANLASRAISAAKSALGIASPSKVAEKEVGQWYSAGVAKGIDDKAKDVQKSVANLLDTKNLTLDTVIGTDTSGIGELLTATVSARVSSVSTALEQQASSATASTGNTVVVHYSPEQKCDEPITARELDAINRQNARRIERLVKNA